MLLFYNISFSQIVYREQFFFWDLSPLYCHFSLFVFYSFPSFQVNISVIYQQEIRIIFSCSKSWLRFFFLFDIHWCILKVIDFFILPVSKYVCHCFKKGSHYCCAFKTFNHRGLAHALSLFQKVEKALPSLSYLVYPLLHDPYFTLHNLWRNMKIKQRPNGFLGKIQF